MGRAQLASCGMPCQGAALVLPLALGHPARPIYFRVVSARSHSSLEDLAVVAAHQKERFLYNAITRARRWVLVLEQNKTILAVAHSPRVIDRILPSEEPDTWQLPECSVSPWRRTCKSLFLTRMFLFQSLNECPSRRTRRCILAVNRLHEQDLGTRRKAFYANFHKRTIRDVLLNHW